MSEPIRLFDAKGEFTWPDEATMAALDAGMVELICAVEAACITLQITDAELETAIARQTVAHVALKQATAISEKVCYCDATTAAKAMIESSRRDYVSRA